MSASAGYQWRRDKDGLGVWEHRGKVAVAGVGHSPVDRRWDEVSMDQTLGAYSILACRNAMDEAGVTPDQVDRHLLRQPYRRRQRRLCVSVGAPALLCPGPRQ